jgi:hypothetical protein
MATDREVSLTSNQRSELSSIAQSRTLPASYVFRAKLILMLAEGASFNTIKRMLQTSAPTIIRWKQRWRDWLFMRSPKPQIQALAVLPLTNLSGDPEEEYFADGMTGTLTKIEDERRPHNRSRCKPVGKRSMVVRASTSIQRLVADCWVCRVHFLRDRGPTMH